MKAMSLKAASLGALSMLLLFGAASTQGGSARAQDTKKTQPAAQSSEQPSWIQVTVVRVKPEMVPEFLKLAKETIPAHRKAGVEWRDFWVTDSFGDFNEYTIVTPFKKFAVFDAGSELEQGLGKAGFEEWLAKARKVVESVNSYAVITRPDLSYIGKMTGPPKLAVSFTTRVAPGHEQEYENYMKNDYLPVIERAGIKALYIGQTVFGGAGEYVGISPIDSFADIDKGPPIRRVLSAAEAEKLTKKLAPGVVVSQSLSIVRYLPELSYSPAQSGTGSAKK